MVLLVIAIRNKFLDITTDYMDVYLNGISSLIFEVMQKSKEERSQKPEDYYG
jgi:hypothetical protein